MIRAAALSIVFGTVALGCHGDGAKPREVTVEQLAAMLKSDRPPKLYDANGDATRSEYGTIPGSILLSGSNSYSFDVLPKDKNEPLVFYCASTWCGAAEGAARRAMSAGYESVAVLPDGIKGWARAGMPVAHVR